jgi:2,4-dienoyl-CoA reductase (NADPH2)
MFQRKAGSLGRGLGKSTGWILKARLREAGVAMTAGATYDAIDDQGLHYTVNSDRHVLPADTIVICAGQLSNRELDEQLRQRGIRAHVIGGADVASELDALRAIDQATRLAVSF